MFFVIIPHYMPERLRVRPLEIKPTRYSPCSLVSIQNLQPLFIEGQEAVNRLDPIVLLRNPDSKLDSNSLLLYDGNTRLTLSFIHGLVMPAIIYTLGEVIEATGPITRTAATFDLINKTLGYRNAAERARYTSFADHARAVDKELINRALAAEFNELWQNNHLLVSH